MSRGIVKRRRSHDRGLIGSSLLGGLRRLVALAVRTVRLPATAAAFTRVEPASRRARRRAIRVSGRQAAS